MATLILYNEAQRAKAIDWIKRAPDRSRVEFKRPKRSLPQNDRLHAMITEIADQLTWHGAKLSVADWKLVFMAALKQEMRIVPNIDGTGFVQLGRSTSDLSVEDFGELMDLIEAFAAQHDVNLTGG